MAYNRNRIYQGVGKLIKLYNQLDTFDNDTLDTTFQESQALYINDDDDRVFAGSFLSDINSMRTTSKSFKDLVKTRADDYFTNVVRNLIGSTSSDPSDIITDLIRLTNEAIDKAEANTTGNTTPTGYKTNGNAGNLTVDELTQMCRNDDFIEVKCTSDGTHGEESWTVTSKKFGAASGTATTGEQFHFTEGGVKFTIRTGTLIEEYGDDRNQLDGWVLSGFGTGNSTVGKIYVKLESYTGYAYGSRTDVYLYSDFDRTSLVASGGITGLGTVTLAEENGSGLSGTVILNATYGSQDTDIWLRVPLFLQGDKFLFGLTSSENSLFVNWFRDVYAKELPSAAYYNVTILDSWTQ